MHTRLVLPALFLALTPSCKGVDCGEGTAERNGACVPASQTVSAAKCGKFTVLQGDTCVPEFPPTTCDDDTTAPDTDTSTGVTTCIGTGTGGCAARLPCPAPAGGTQTICGQIYDFETSLPFAAPGATGTQCTPGAVTGPCALAIKAYDAVMFAGSNGTSGALQTGAVYIDDCGRYRVPDIMQPAMPLIALGFDDAAPPAGPSGVTSAVGVATGAMAGLVTRDLDGYVVRGSVAAGWGTPALSAGIYAMVFHGHRTGTDLATGVQFRFGSMTSGPTMTNADRDFYFPAGSTTRVTLGDSSLIATGANGTVLVSGANLGEVYSGNGGLSSTACAWDVHGGAAVPGVVFVQSFRPINATGMTCPL